MMHLLTRPSRYSSATRRVGNAHKSLSAFRCIQLPSQPIDQLERRYRDGRPMISIKPTEYSERKSRLQLFRVYTTERIYVRTYSYAHTPGFIAMHSAVATLLSIAFLRVEAVLKKCLVRLSAHGRTKHAALECRQYQKGS